MRVNFGGGLESLVTMKIFILINKIKFNKNKSRPPPGKYAPDKSEKNAPLNSENDIFAQTPPPGYTG